MKDIDQPVGEVRRVQSHPMHYDKKRNTPMVSLLVVLIAIGAWITPAWAAAPDGQEDICTSPAVIFCDNFESRSLGFGDLVRGTFKNSGWSPSAFYSHMAISDTPAGVYEGRRALQFRYPAGAGGIGFMGTFFPTPYRTLYFRWYQKWSDAFTFSPVATKGAILNTATGQSLYVWWNNWGDGLLSQWANSTVTELEANLNGAFAPARDRWYCLEMRVTMNTAANADGYVQAWVDGVQHWEHPNVLLDSFQPNAMTSWLLTGYWNCLDTSCNAPEDQHPLMYRWHDNFVISTERIGCLSATPELAITGVSPPSGSTAGGTTVDITGSGFTAGSTVQIGGVNATAVTVNNAGWIRAVTPPGSTGRVDVTVSTVAGSAVLTGEFNYLPPATELLRDDFGDGVADGWTLSPLGNAAGWRVVDGVYTYEGGSHTQAYRGEAFWSDYTLEVKFRLSTLSNFPGGIRGRVNPATGTGYEVWLFPATGEIALLRPAAWHIDTPGLMQLALATGIPFDTGPFHSLRIAFAGPVIEVYYDGTLVIRVTDPTHDRGVIALDVSTQRIEFDDVVVSTHP
ncbi:MAG: IPT/TIG domain-containing protein [Gaiellales bacterium]